MTIRKGSGYSSYDQSRNRGTPLPSDSYERECVRKLQSWLAVEDVIAANTFDANHKPDGLAGPGTDSAIKAFQKKNGLKDDGVVGPKTWATLAPLV